MIKENSMNVGTAPPQEKAGRDMVDPRAYWDSKALTRPSGPPRILKPVYIVSEHLPSGCILYRVGWQGRGSRKLPAPQCDADEGFGLAAKPIWGGR